MSVVSRMAQFPDEPFEERLGSLNQVTTSKTLGLDSIHGTAAHSHPFGEMPLRDVTKAAVFLPLQIFEKGLEPPWCRFVQLMAAKNDHIFCRIFFAYFWHIFRVFSHIFACFRIF